MEIKDLQPRQGKVELVGSISEKGDVRTIEKPNFSGKVCNAKLQDSTGTIKMTLWNDQCDTVNNGDTVKITNGYVSEYQGEMQLSTGKFGKLEVVSKAAAQEQNNNGKKSFAEEEFEETEDDEEV